MKRRKRKKPQKEAQKPFDWGVGERGPGRPGVRFSEIQGRSKHYRLIFGQIWERLRDPLLNAKTEQEAIQAFEQYGSPYAQEFVPALASLILKVIHGPKFPKWPEPQANFLADSLAGRGWISPSRSRDICGSERAKDRLKSPYHILRREFYIECSCGYKGPARDDACRKCGAEIPFWMGTWLSPESD